MNSNRITQLHVYLIGGVLMLIVGAGLWYFTLKPLDDGNKALKAQVDSLKATSVSVDQKPFTIDTAKNAQTTLDAAKDRVAGKTVRLASLERSKQLAPRERLIIPKGGATVGEPLNRWLLLGQHVVTTMDAFTRKLERKHHVRVFYKYGWDAPVPDPAAIPTDIVARKLGDLTVYGDFRNVMEWARDWNSAPLVCALDGLKVNLAGAKGEVIGTASLTVYVFPTGEGAGGSGGGSAGGGGGDGSAGMSPMGGGGFGGSNAPGGGAAGGANAPGRFSPSGG